MSRDLVGSSAFALAWENHLKDSETVHTMLGIALGLSFPDIHADYSKAFQAGAVFEADPGPWIGRAILWKMQTDGLHFDTNDGYTADTAFGNFKNGYLELPQFQVRLR